MVQLILTSVAAVNITRLVHVRRSVTVVLVDQSVVEGNLRITHLQVEVSVVETKTIGQGQLLDRLDVSLDLTEYLLRIVVVIVVLYSPVGVGDTIRRIPSLRCIESSVQVLTVNETDVTWELEDTIDE